MICYRCIKQKFNQITMYNDMKVCLPRAAEQGQCNFLFYSPPLGTYRSLRVCTLFLQRLKSKQKHGTDWILKTSITRVLLCPIIRLFQL